MRHFYDGLDRSDPAKKLRHFWHSDDRGLFFGDNISSASTSIPDYEIVHPKTGKSCKKPSRGWGCNPDEMERRIAEDRVLFGQDETTIPLKKSYLLEVDSIVKTPVLYKDGRGASMTLRGLLGPAAFDNPKDHLVLAEFIAYMAPADALVMDFFAGSGSTAHAVWHQNAVDNGTRRYILVQLPEPLDPNDKNQKAAVHFCDQIGKPRNIAELTKERLRRAASKIIEDNPLFKGDMGFRAFKLASSNIRAWEVDRSDIEHSLLKHSDHLILGRSEQDVLYELLLKLGLDLCVPISTRTISGKAVHSIGGGALIVCLADGLTRDVIESLSAGILGWYEELAPAVETRVVFKDSGFVDDVAKTNMAAILNQGGLPDVRSL
jgi:adenine-specific DNA-methyltransferase